MLGFIIGLVWLLVAFGNDKSFAGTTGSVSSFLFWWYVATSVATFFTVFLCQSDEVVDEISTRFLRGMSITKEQCFGATMMAFIASRFLLFLGLNFLNKSVLVEEALRSNKFTVGAIILFLGAMMGVSSLLPWMAYSMLQNKR